MDDGAPVSTRRSPAAHFQKAKGNRQLQQYKSDRALKQVVSPVLVVSVRMLWAAMATAILGGLQGQHSGRYLAAF
tara:strand:- start:185 stop:409 length:225 start_codon:yes stop_codon:yes gene_type:complete